MASKKNHEIIPVRASWMWVATAFFFFVSVSMVFAKGQKKSTASGQEKTDALLAAAMDKMSTGVWSVDGTVTSKKTIKLHGLLSGEDFDLSMDPGAKPGVPMRGIVIKDKAWVCSDGETWHAGKSDDRLLYNWAHTPIMIGRQLPPFEEIGTEQRNGQTCLHVRLRVPEKKVDPKELPQYWLVLDSQGQAQYIGHTEMPMFSQARNEVIYCSFDYAPAKENIAPPALGPPVGDKAYGFNDIEQHKFDWKGKIVRVEVTPKLLQSEQISEDTYRAFLKDTATPNHYGVVEFPHDALVKLGFLKRIVSGTHAWEDLQKMGALGRAEGEPVSFYVEVIPIGEKPAARAVAVGAKFVRDANGSVSYTWDTGKGSGEKQQGKDETDQKPAESRSSASSPAADEASTDLINRGVEKEKKGDLNGAIADFSRAIELDPKAVCAYYSRAFAKSDKDGKWQWRDLDGVISDFTRAIELNPNGADFCGDHPSVAYRFRADARLEKGDINGAIADYDRAIELLPSNFSAYYKRGKARKAKGDLDGAIADFTEAIGIASESTEAYKARAEAKQAKGDAAGAAEDFKQAGEPQPEDSQHPGAEQSVADLVTRGGGKGEKGDLDGALADFDRAIARDPKNSGAYFNRAYAKRLKNDAAGAIADYTRAIEIDPSMGDAYYNRGNVKARNNDADGAIADYNRAIEVERDFARAYHNRAVIKEAKGDVTGARADFTKAEGFAWAGKQLLDDIGFKGELNLTKAKTFAPESASEESAADSKNNRPSEAMTVSLLDGKLKFDIPSDFSRDPDDPKEPKTLAKFSGPDSAWGEVLRGTHGLTPDKLEGYLKMRVAEYSKGFNWLPKDSHLQWLKKEIVTIDGRKWADWRYVPMLKGKKDYSHNPVYTRFLTTSYKGQLLEINFTSNLNTDPELKEQIDHIMDSVHLEQ